MKRWMGILIFGLSLALLSGCITMGISRNLGIKIIMARLSDRVKPTDYGFWWR